MNNLMGAYQPMYQPQMRQQTNGIIWVQGLEGAKAYQMMPSTNAIMLDSETDNRFYIKTADNVGMCSLRTFKFQEITDNIKNGVDTSKFVTREEFDALIKALGGKPNGKQLVQSTQPKQQPIATDVK